MLHARGWLLLKWTKCPGQTSIMSARLWKSFGCQLTPDHSCPLKHPPHSVDGRPYPGSAGSGSNFRGWRCREVESSLRQEQQRPPTVRQVAVVDVRPMLHRVLRWLEEVMAWVSRQTSHAGKTRYFSSVIASAFLMSDV